jgi:hypothetical protein
MLGEMYLFCLSGRSLLCGIRWGVLQFPLRSSLGATSNGRRSRLSLGRLAVAQCGVGRGTANLEGRSQH